MLSHCLDFLRLIAKRCDKSALKTLQIDRHNSIDSRITELDLDDEAAAQVDKDVIQLRSYYMGDDKNAAATVRCIRPLLENHIRKMAPDHAPAGNGWLGDFLKKIREADSTSALAMFKSIYDDLDQLNEYTAPYAHDSGMSAPIDDGELAVNARLTLEVIGRL